MDRAVFMDFPKEIWKPGRREAVLISLQIKRTCALTDEIKIKMAKSCQMTAITVELANEINNNSFKLINASAGFHAVFLICYRTSEI